MASSGAEGNGAHSSRVSDFGSTEQSLGFQFGDAAIVGRSMCL